MIAILTRYPAEREICSHLFLNPMKVYNMPVAMRIIPATAKAGVISGWRGNSPGNIVAASMSASCQSLMRAGVSYN